MTTFAPKTRFTPMTVYYLTYCRTEHLYRGDVDDVLKNLGCFATMISLEKKYPMDKYRKVVIDERTTKYFDETGCYYRIEEFDVMSSDEPMTADYFFLMSDLKKIEN